MNRGVVERGVEVEKGCPSGAPFISLSFAPFMLPACCVRVALMLRACRLDAACVPPLSCVRAACVLRACRLDAACVASLHTA
jgi:hypothetical protein